LFRGATTRGLPFSIFVLLLNLTGISTEYIYSFRSKSPFSPLYLGMSDPTIKNIQLTGGVSTEMGSTRKKKGKGVNKTFKIERGGGSTSPGTLVQLTASSLPGSPDAPEPVGRNSPLTAKGAPVQTAGKAEQPVKVVLTAPKKKGRVVLAPAKPAVAPAKTRKISQTKKVRVTISNLSKKINKAKEIRKVATETTLEELKKVLHKAGLIKADSKAPDTMLRQMYADYMTLKGRAL